MKSIITILSFILCTYSYAQKHTDNTKLNFDASQYEVVHIYNTGGIVNVKANNSANTSIDVKRTITAKSDKKLERAKAEIYLDTTVVDGELFIYIENPYKVLKGDHNDQHLYYTSRDKNGWSGNEWQEIGVKYVFDMEISIPAATNMVVSTHTEDLTVTGIKGDLYALNHHDNVTLNNVGDVHYAHSHHGDVEVSFANQPQNDISFDTHHGDITVSFPSTPSAEIEFDSYHGSFYTDFDWTPSAAKLEKTESGRKRKAEYKVGKRTIVAMGDGAQKLTFDSHHGDMFILKNSL